MAIRAEHRESLDVRVVLRLEEQMRPLLAQFNMTRLQSQVLARVACGYTNRMIGEDLYITEDTVKHHIKRILRNLGAHDRAHAVHLAWWHGLIGGNLRPLKRVV